MGEEEEAAEMTMGAEEAKTTRLKTEEAEADITTKTIGAGSSQVEEATAAEEVVETTPGIVAQ